MQYQLSDPSQWVDLYGNEMFLFCKQRVNDITVAEDLVQEAFLGGLKSRSSFKGQSSEKSWLIGILKHKIMDHYRKTSKDINFNQLVNDEENFATFFEQQKKGLKDQYSWGQNPSENLENEEFMKVFQKCLENIPSKLARVFTMRELDNISAEDICKELNITPTNVWVILHRARAGLKSCLEANWFKTSKNGNN